MKPIMIKPPKLQPGDKVATVSLSSGGAGKIPHRYQTGKHQLQDEFKLQVIEMPHTQNNVIYFHNNHTFGQEKNRPSDQRTIIVIAIPCCHHFCTHQTKTSEEFTTRFQKI